MADTVLRLLPRKYFVTDALSRPDAVTLRPDLLCRFKVKASQCESVFAFSTRLRYRHTVKRRLPWQRMIGILAVLLIGSLMIGQTAEAFTCSSEIVTVDTGVSTNVGASDAQKADLSHGKSSGVCQHGHCHQSLRVIDPVTLSDPTNLAADVPPAARDAAIADGRVYTIDYPPRA